MDGISLLLLCASISLSTGRNLLSKNISDERFGTKKFFALQSLIFLSGAILLAVVGIWTSLQVSLLTVCYAFIYGILLVSAQWNYTIALKNGKTGICSTVYSLGFILPTVFGSIAFREKFSLWDGLGICAVIPAIILAGTKKGNSVKTGNKFFLPLIVAMLCSGGLGIMQKVQQNSAYPDEKVGFTFLSFAVASICSFICFCFGHKQENKLLDKKSLSGIGIGVAFACCNLLNTILAGRLSSAVFFPVLNVGTILLSLVLGILCFKERVSKKDILIFGLGVVAIFLITIG